MDQRLDDCTLPPSKRIKIDEDAIADSNGHPNDAEENKQVMGGVCGGADMSLGFIREEDVGITEYISNTGSRFTGIIKQRYSDFIVNEISFSDEIVHLTSLDLPPDPNKESKDCLSSLLSSEEISQLQELSQSKDKRKQIEFKVPDSKEERTKIHVSIRNEYPSLDSRTITGDREDIKLIRVFLRGSRGSNNRSNWPSKVGGDYVKFVLYKENRDTSQTINRLASMLKVKPSVFQYGGTKDKRAVTSQHVTAYRITPQRLLSINGANIGIKLGNFEYAKYQMKLGSLSGNHFTIIIRNIQSKSEDHVLVDDIGVSVDSLERVGFINYFGMQRFGTSVIPTHHIGKALLHSNWQEAIDLILKPRNGEPPGMNAARLHYQNTKDIPATLEIIPKNKQNTAEVILLKGLQKYGNNLLASLNCIPRGSRTMYCHGYQSYIWNKLASYRVRTHGLVPIPGDIVHKKKNGNESEDLDSNPMIDVEYITETNIDEYTIYDVILPLPGYTVKYPKNDVGDEYAKALAADGLTSEKLLHRVKEFSLSGGYRNLIMKPKDVKWELMKYDDVTLPLTLSDLDILEGKKLPKSIEDGSKIALKIEFSLSSSTYATMALREILKTETSSHYQSLLNHSDEMHDSDLDLQDDNDGDE